MPPPAQAKPVGKTVKIPLKSFSIKLNGNQPVNLVEEDAPVMSKREKTAVRNESFTQDDLTRMWENYVKTLNTDMHIIKSVEKGIPILKSDNQFELKIDSGIQENIILDMKGEILAFLRDKLNNDNINFTTSIEENVTQKPITQQDRFNEMLTQNEDFRRLANELSLEI